MSQVTERAIKVLKEQLGVSEINNTDRLDEDLGGDSLDLIETTMALEDEFGIEIPDEFAEQWITVQNVLDYIEKNVK